MVTPDQIKYTALDVAYAERHIRTAVERLCDTLGSHLVYDESPLQPLLRDVLTISTHRVWSWQAGMLPYGQWRLGPDSSQNGGTA